VYIRNIFLSKPLLGLAVLLCMGAMLVLFKLNRTPTRNRSDRFLIPFLGLLSIYQAMRVLTEARVVQFGWNAELHDAIELLMATLCLVAALIVRLARSNEFQLESALRLAQAAPPHFGRPAENLLSVRDLSTIEALNWAVPRLSDGAFKLFAFLCLHADRVTGRVGVDQSEVRLQLGKSKQDLDACLDELERCGAISRRASTAGVEIEVVAQSRHSLQQPPERLPQPGKLVTDQPA
jgi:biotin operon repressor